jgi:hypothetical protein
MKIYDTLGTQVYTDTKSISSLNSGATQQVTFSATFNPLAKYYKAKCYTSLGSDANNNNDTLTVSFNYSQFSLNLTALIQGFFNGTSMLPDTVTVELRDTTAPYLLEASKKVVLNTAGTGIINNFTTQLNSISHYYIVVKHRNSIETWSSFGNIFNSSTLSYNFTSAATQAYGSNMILKGGKYCLYSGDVIHDGQVTFSDLIAIDNDNNNYISGYTNTDITGDNQVTFSDLIIVDNNNTNYIVRQVPTGAPVAKQVKNKPEEKRLKVN